MFDMESKRETLLEIVTVLVNAIDTNQIVIEDRAIRSSESRNAINEAINKARFIIEKEEKD
jgi:hypothetical protein|tara:strand:+ start:129 stop:311 length:183 start_codon:yes stop_codon:yes gene_type:complete